MTANVVELREENERLREMASRIGGGPPDGGGVEMEHRVTVLETKLEAILPTLTTKSDLEGLRTDLHRGFSELTRWVLGTAIACTGLGVAAISFLQQRHPQVTAAPAPVVVMYPAQAQTVPAVPISASSSAASAAR